MLMVLLTLVSNVLFGRGALPLSHSSIERIVMPKDLEKIRKDIMKANPKMKESLAYALATNILKKRKAKR